MPKYSVGIIGCGGIAPSHIRGWLNTGSAEMTAVADINPAKAKALAEKFGVKKSYSDYVEMLREESLDFVSICTWAQTHAGITVKAAENGVKGILCEKPMATSLGEADAMIKACNKHNVKLAIRFQRRFHPIHLSVRKFISEGFIGEPLFVHGRSEDGLLNNGSHIVNTVRFWLGDPEPEWVIGQVERKTDRYERGAPIEDLCMSLIGFKDGVKLLLESDTPIPPRLRLFRTVVECTEGLIYVTDREAKVLSNEGWINLKPIKDEATEFSQLIDWVEGKINTHRSSGYQARIDMEIMMAIYESSRTRSLIHMPLKTLENPLYLMIKEGKLPVLKPGRYDIRLPKDL
ncbi:Gfo/Idh/MocA family oxidoreductase [Candidatus Bathyarchaeota archaeon]|nr:Gfo/Idh/MocA family oxidoreductase [Candidatus Bathyarchaeota archaeon]